MVTCVRGLKKRGQCPKIMFETKKGLEKEPVRSLIEQTCIQISNKKVVKLKRGYSMDPRANLTLRIKNN
jgi:L-serine deaminase